MWKPTRALITGASSGLGESFARKLAAQGVHLVLVARRRERLLALSEELKTQFGVKVDYIALDLSQEQSPKNLFDFATHSGMTVDLLINNAGIGPYRPFVKSSWNEHCGVIYLNIRALTELTHLFCQHMLTHGLESRILNVASVASYHPLPKFSVYSGSKFFVRNFSQIVRYELRGSNVSVSCLCPGGTATEFLQSNNQELKLSSVLMSTDQVTDAALKALTKNKAIIIPGIFNKLDCWLSTLFPDFLNLFLAEKAMGLAIAEADES